VIGGGDSEQSVVDRKSPSRGMKLVQHTGATVGATFYCVAAGGSLTVPAWVLSALPASGVASDIPIPIGFLGAGATLSSPGRFQARGVDAGYFNWGTLQIKNVNFQEIRSGSRRGSPAGGTQSRCEAQTAKRLGIHLGLRGNSEEPIDLPWSFFVTRQMLPVVFLQVPSIHLS
jgi:hypothetical protein